MTRSAVARIGALGILVGLAVVLLATPARAHASLLSTTPADGQVVVEAPAQITLRFNEGVMAPTAGVRVFDAAGDRVDTGDPVVGDDESIGVALAADLPDGTYVVTWRATSADGHLVRGAFVFSVGLGDEVDDALVARLFRGDDTAVVEALAWFLRVVTYVSVLLVVGAGMWRVAVRSDEPIAATLVRRGATVGLVSSLLLVPVTVEVVTGLGLGQAVRPDVILESIGQPGVAALIRTVGLVGVLGAITRARRAVLPFALLALGSFLFDGHTRTQDPAWVMWVADAVHLVAAATWLGGLAILGAVLRRERATEDPADAAADVGAFSRLATWSLVGVLAAGSAMAWALVREPRTLTSTDFGVALLIKVTIVGLVIVAAAYNNRVLVPAVTTGRGGMAQLSRTVRFEVVGLVLAIAVTGVLAQLRPASDEAGITGAFQTTVAVTEELSMDVIVDPNRAGANEIHVYLVDATGRPVSNVDDVRLRLEQPERQIGPIERDPIVAGPGHWQLTGRELSIPGTWEIRVIVGIDRFDERTVTVPVVVNP
ncbi:MAG: copper resistance protein CopC [Nitriliruptorales bacterium]|nr:copper resistance protein CopC [Nitriliruptorales bacterium]